MYINVVKKETGLNIWAMLYYNNVTTMPALFVLAWYTGDLQRACESLAKRGRVLQRRGGVCNIVLRVRALRIWAPPECARAS